MTKLSDLFKLVKEETFVGITEAPNDGLQYSRQNSGWVETVGSIKWTSTVTSPISKDNGYFIDTSSTPQTITLPSSAQVSDTFAVMDINNNASTNNITLNRNGLNINGSASNLVITENGWAGVFTYVNASVGWKLVSVSSILGSFQDFSPKTQLNNNDLFLIEDSEDSYNKKRFSFADLLDEQFVSVPSTPNSTGLKGQMAYDSINTKMYICIENNTWVRFNVEGTW